MYYLTFSHRFPYTYDNELFKPIIPVTFKYNGLEFTYPMLIDSGSSITAFRPEMAEKGFGLDPVMFESLPEYTKGRVFSGRTNYRRLDGVTILISENELELMGPVCFVEQLTDCGFGLLGREGVFDNLRIAFSEQQGRSPYIYMSLDIT